MVDLCLAIFYFEKHPFLQRAEQILSTTWSNFLKILKKLAQISHLTP
jgi:hypothetical protein